MEAEPSLPHTCKALVGLKTGSYHATTHSVRSGRPDALPTELSRLNACRELCIALNSCTTGFVQFILFIQLDDNVFILKILDCFWLKGESIKEYHNHYIQIFTINLRCNVTYCVQLWKVCRIVLFRWFASLATCFLPLIDSLVIIIGGNETFDDISLNFGVAEVKEVEWGSLRTDMKITPLACSAVVLLIDIFTHLSGWHSNCHLSAHFSISLISSCNVISSCLVQIM